MEDEHGLRKQRIEILNRLNSWFETPMVILGFVWLLLLALELLNQSSKALETIGLVIWIVFIIDFSIKFILAPEKLIFLKGNIITIISLLVPAFRVFRIFRLLGFLRITRGIRLVKVLGSLNRGMSVLSGTLKRRAIGFIVAFTFIVLFVGAAGMFAFEKDINPGFSDYPTALWWTAMILTTMGSQEWPLTTEGRILCIIISLYAFAIFGYVTATIASFFIGQDALNEDAEIAGSTKLEGLRKEIAELKDLIIRKSS